MLLPILSLPWLPDTAGFICECQSEMTLVVNMKELPSNAKTLAISIRAIQLLGAWHRVAQGHLPLNGFACSCSLGIGGITVQDFEQDVLDYLFEKHGNVDELKNFFKNISSEKYNTGALAALLRSLSVDFPDATNAEQLLDDLEKTIGSFSEAHREMKS